MLRLQQYIPDDAMTGKVVFMMLPLLGKGFQVALLKPASLDPHCFPYMSVHYYTSKIEIQNCISFAFFFFFFSTLIYICIHFQASRLQRSNHVSPFVPDVDVDHPEPQPNVARNAEAPILPVDGNNGRQPIASPQPSDDGAAANVAVNHEQRRHLRPLAQVFFFYLLSLYSPCHLTYRGSGRAIPLHALQTTNIAF